MFKVFILYYTMAPYRHPLFEELSKDLDLTVYYLSKKHNLREWEIWPRSYSYNYKILPRIPFKTPFEEEISFNPSIIKELLMKKPDIVIFYGYLDPTLWLALVFCKLFKI